MRGNRTVKVDTGSLDAFHCPNMPPLVVAGINIDVDYKAIHRPTTIEKVSFMSCLHIKRISAENFIRRPLLFAVSFLLEKHVQVKDYYVFQ